MYPLPNTLSRSVSEAAGSSESVPGGQIIARTKQAIKEREQRQAHQEKLLRDCAESSEKLVQAVDNYWSIITRVVWLFAALLAAVLGICCYALYSHLTGMERLSHHLEEKISENSALTVSAYRDAELSRTSWDLRGKDGATYQLWDPTVFKANGKFYVIVNKVQ